MNWSEVRSIYPETWLIIEALEAHTTDDNYRIPDRVAAIEACPTGEAAFERYRRRIYIIRYNDEIMGAGCLD